MRLLVDFAGTEPDFYHNWNDAEAQDWAQQCYDKITLLGNLHKYKFFIWDQVTNGVQIRKEYYGCHRLAYL